MQIQDFISIGIVSAGMSLAVDYFKEKWGINGWATKTLVVLLSLIVGLVYVWLRETSYFETVLSILGTSSLVYAFFLKK